jgi:transposase
LEARLNQTARNSSVPPSSAHPHAKPKRDQPRSRRQRGGQPGHRKHVRPLLPPEQCTDIQELKPTNCRRCGAGLTGADPEPLRHQVWELPVIRPEVIEYRRHRLACPGCGETTCAALPAGIPESQSGPRLVAFAGLLMAFFRQSKRRTALFLETLLHQPCCPALTIKMQTQVTAALRPAYDELAAALPAQP